MARAACLMHGGCVILWLAPLLHIVLAEFLAAPDSYSDLHSSWWPRAGRHLLWAVSSPALIGCQSSTTNYQASDPWTSLTGPEESGHPGRAGPNAAQSPSFQTGQGTPRRPMEIGAVQQIRCETRT